MEQSTLDNDNPDEYFSDIIEMDLDGSCSSSTLSGRPPKKKKKTDISWLAEIAQERLEQQKDHHRKKEEHDVRQEKMVQDLISTQTKFQNDLLDLLEMPKCIFHHSPSFGKVVVKRALFQRGDCGTEPLLKP
ncbi:uncharacterized protein LOC117191049 [Drosophila miranda]|uniref:uncharacterized protein LOC117191049 n=1 Tax=Drosophila miranda TaxID=7229 RepID=UPI00143F989E|nr:uncharacterized protein LOC117191049 [Drosophila miranda]